MSGTPQLLHDPSRERDACGIGLVADVRGRASRELLDRALAGLAAVSHRGAWAADGVTGDGAGVLLPLSAALTGAPGAGIAMCFLREPWLKSIVEEACRAEGLEPAGWREVPHDVAALGSTATASMPRIAQLLLAPTALADVEARSTRARRRAETVPGIYVASLSFSTVTYKALCAATQLSTFYPDLVDPAYAVAWAIFHQRFSTNTEPSWERAQPFRFLCHNGEINTIEGNVGWMEARARALGLEEGLAPSLDPNGSDSALLDNALELLVRSGLEVREAVTLLVPPAWQNDPRLEPEVRDLHRYGAMLVEPWDGPAGLVFTDGRVCGAALDRNGLRPLRVSVSSDGIVAVATEAGAVPLPEGKQVRRARLGPGQVLSLDPERGLQYDGELKRDLASRRPYGSWVEQSTVRVPAGDPVAVPDGDLGPRHALFGYTREDLSLMLRPIARTGHDPVYSMGDDAPLAPLAGRPRPLASYFRQRFAQVTSPAIDHYRERAVMSVTTLLGPRAGLGAAGPLPRLTVLPGFLVTPSGLAALDPVRIEITFTAEDELGPATERVVDACIAAVEGGATLICLSDATAGGGRAPIPSLLAVAAAHSRLVEAGLRTRCSVLAESDEPRDTHMIATLLGFGADAICPRLALETVAQLASVADGGTGASPLPSIKHAGAPWELGLAETQQALVANNLRGRVRLRVDGGFKTGRDVLVAALLGADEYSFGTALLLAEGCLMVRSCHLDTCPVGIASQRPELRAKFAGTPEMVEAYLLFVAQEVRELLASFGFRRLDDAIGRVECLRQVPTGDPSADAIDLAPLLGKAGDGHARYVGLPVPHEGDRLGALLLAAGRGALEETRLVEPGYAITNADRAVGARLAGAIAKQVGSAGPQGRIRARFEGSAGQSFGAFLTAGVELDLVGEANDYVGKSMSGGRIVVAPPAGDAGDPVLIGNTVLYGATGGELYCAGSAGERFAVRNSGATAVVEGVGDHACEYMTRGTVVVLGFHGRNLGAGMTGGEAFLLDPDERLVNYELVAVVELDGDDEQRLLRILDRHRRATGSARAAALLDDLPSALPRFRRVVPHALVRDREERLTA